MKKVSLLVAILSLVFIMTGCTDKTALKEVLDNQQEIIESQTDILAKLTALETKVQNVQAPPSRPQIDYNTVQNLPIDKSVIKGDQAGPVTIVEFSDFQCPYCSRLQPTLKDVMKAYPKGVKLVYKHFPLSFHKQAKNAAKAAESAREQGKFWEMHDLIYENFNKLTDQSYDEFAAKLGLDMAKFKADYASNKYDKLIQDDINLGRKVGVTGTPSLFMNGKRMQGRSLDDFKAGIDKLLKK